MPDYRTVLLLIALVGAVVGGCLIQRQQASPPSAAEWICRVGGLYGLPCRSGGEFAHHSPCQTPPTNLPRARRALGVRGLSWPR